MSAPRPMPEEYWERSRKSVWALIQDMAAIGEVLRKELPYDSLTATWHNEDGTDDFMTGICARMGNEPHFLTIYTRYFNAPPEPSEIYPQKIAAQWGLLKSILSHHRHENRSKFVERPNGGWCISTTSGFRCQHPTLRFY